MKTEVYIKFNDMLNDGKHTYDECYAWLMEQKNIEDMEFYNKHGYHLCNDFSYLYPEAIFWDNKELREEFIQKMKDLDAKRDNLNKIEEKLKEKGIDVVGHDNENLYVKSNKMDENAIRKIVKEFTKQYKMKEKVNVDFTEFLGRIIPNLPYGTRNIVESVLDDMGIIYEDGGFYINEK